MEYERECKLKRIWKFYISNALLRNISAIFFDVSCILLLCHNIKIVYTTPLKLINWCTFVISIVFVFLFKKLSTRLRVTKVCPQCLENRGISEDISTTGNTKNYRTYIKGDYWQHEEDVEYLKTKFCNYCLYQTSELYWETETWQGELTEEAKIERAAEAHRIAEKRARIDAYEEIRRRYYR